MLPEEVKAIRERAGVLVRGDLFTVALRGKDRVRFLNGMVSGDITKLKVGRGLSAVKLDNRGHLEGLVRVRCEKDALLLDLHHGCAQRVAQTLASLIVMDDCQLTDQSDDREVVGLYGPSAERLAAVLANDPPRTDHAFEATEIGTVVRNDWLGLPGYDCFCPIGTSAAVVQRLEEAGATSVSAEALEIVRVEAGVPLDGQDLDLDTIPMEARLDALMDPDKGCYLGQEIVARVSNFGGVKHILVGFSIEGEAVPETDLEVLARETEEPIGELTSAVRSPTLGVIGLGYVKKKAEAPGTAVLIRGSRAQVVLLPHV